MCAQVVMVVRRKARAARCISAVIYASHFRGRCYGRVSVLSWQAKCAVYLRERRGGEYQYGCTPAFRLQSGAQTFAGLPPSHFSQISLKASSHASRTTKIAFARYADIYCCRDDRLYQWPLIVGIEGVRC